MHSTDIAPLLHAVYPTEEDSDSEHRVRPRLGAKGVKDAHASNAAGDSAGDAAVASAHGAGTAAEEPIELLDEDDAGTGEPFLLSGHPNYAC